MYDSIHVSPLVRIGAGPPPGHLGGLLLECHGRIRAFLAIARRLAAGVEADPSEVQEAARGIHRYFATAFPLHVADEEETIWPALRGTDPQLDAALDEASAEHGGHARMVAELIESAASLATPGRGPAAALGAVAAALEAELVPHLDAEERAIFPALGRLPVATVESLSAALRGRRTGR